VERLRGLARTAGLDLCGENGEYHTLVLDGPDFAASLDLARTTVHDKGEIMHLEIGQVVRRKKPH